MYHATWCGDYAKTASGVPRDMVWRQCQDCKWCTTQHGVEPMPRLQVVYHATWCGDYAKTILLPKCHRVSKTSVRKERPSQSQFARKSWKINITICAYHTESHQNRTINVQGADKNSFTTLRNTIIIIYLSWRWATCLPVPVSSIHKSLQRSTMIPSASWGVVFHYPGYVTSFSETCQWLKFPLNGLRAQSRVSPAVGLLPPLDRHV